MMVLANNSFCEGLGAVYLLRDEEGSVYQKIPDIFQRKKTPKETDAAGNMA